MVEKLSNALLVVDKSLIHIYLNPTTFAPNFIMVYKLTKVSKNYTWQYYA